MAMFRSSAAPDDVLDRGHEEHEVQVRELSRRGVACADQAARRDMARRRQLGHRVRRWRASSTSSRTPPKQDPFAFRRKQLALTHAKRRACSTRSRSSAAGQPAAARSGIGRGMARHFSFETEVGEVAEVEIVDGRIRVRKVYCVVDCGTRGQPRHRQGADGGRHHLRPVRRARSGDHAGRRRRAADELRYLPAAAHVRGARRSSSDHRQRRRANRRRRARPAADRTRRRERGVRATGKRLRRMPLQRALERGRCRDA